MSTDRRFLEYYSRLAPDYDDRHLCQERIDDVRHIERFGEKAITRLDLLEIACGTGTWTRYASRFASSVVATDLSPEMLHIARSRLRDAANVRFICTDAYHPKVGRSDFSGGMAAWWISHVPRRELRRFFANFHANLAPHAVVLLMDDTPAVEERLRHRDESGDTYALRTLRNGESFEIVKNLYTEQEIRDAIGPMAARLRYTEGHYHWAVTYEVIKSTTPARQ